MPRLRGNSPRGNTGASVRGTMLADRPGRWKLLARRLRRLLRPGLWTTGSLLVIGLAGLFVHAMGTSGSVSGLRAGLGSVTGAFGMRISHIEIEGRANTPEPLLRAALGVRPGEPILAFSPAAARQRIEQLSWVEHATVARLLPGTVLVKLQERRPFAIWQHLGKFVLIDRQGLTVADQDVANFSQLPLVVGLGAPEAAAALLEALAARPALQARVVAAVRVGQRRWNLRLNSGADVLLPEKDQDAALDRLMQLEDAHKLLDRPIQVVDMRLPDRLVLRPAAGVTLPGQPAAKKPT
jgi:cell division protein FtsQ